MTAIGIDFGTTNSVAAIYGNPIEVIPIGTPPAEWATFGMDKVLPSVVAMTEDRSLVFGWEAKLSNRATRFEAIKRLFQDQEIVVEGGEEFFVEEVAAALFRHIQHRVTANGIDASSAVITVPANSRGLARYRTKVCAGMGGIEPLMLINEPTAAAMAYGIDATHDQTVLVFDFGGGTLDVTVLETVDGVFMEQAAKGVPRLGGIDFDNAVYSEIAQESPDSGSWSSGDKQRLKIEIEKAKIRLSSSDEVTIIDPLLPAGYRLTRPRFNEMTRHLVERAEEPIARCLGDLRMGPGSVDAVLLVGGTSKIPAVRHLVAELVGKEAAVGVDPMTAVAEGAAIAAAISTGALQTSDYFVSTEHALGTVVVDFASRSLQFAEIIPRNQKLPAKATEPFSPVMDHQESVRLRVIEGDPDLPVDHRDNVILTEFDVPFDPPRPADEAGFELTYLYDVEGILHIEVRDVMTGEALTDRITVSFKGARNPHELVGMADRVRTMVDSAEVSTSSPPRTQLDPESAELLQKAQTKVIPFVEDGEVEQLSRLVSALEAANGDGVESAQAALRDALRPYSYLF